MFDNMVRDGRLPKPMRFGTATVWDMRLLDRVFDGNPLAANDDHNDDSQWD
jgi:hypothetical protein